MNSVEFFKAAVVILACQVTALAVSLTMHEGPMWYYLLCLPAGPVTAGFIIPRERKDLRNALSVAAFLVGWGVGWSDIGKAFSAHYTGGYRGEPRMNILLAHLIMMAPLVLTMWSLHSNQAPGRKSASATAMKRTPIQVGADVSIGLLIGVVAAILLVGIAIISLI